MHMPCTTTSDCRLSPAYAQDQFAHERVLARLDDCLNPQRAKRTLECSPSAPQSARREARRWMVTTLVQPRTSSAVADAGGAMGAACRKRETRSSAEEEVEALRCDQRQIACREREEELPRVGPALRPYTRASGPRQAWHYHSLPMLG